MSLWHIMQIAVLVFIVIPVGIYLYRSLRRSLMFWGMREEKTKGIAAVVALGLVIFAACSWGPGMIAVIYLACVSICMDLLNLLIRRIGGRRPKWETVHLSGLVPVVITILLVGYGYWNMAHIVETRYTVETKKDVQDYRVALITDLHFGMSIDGSKLREVCERIGTEEPDFVVLGGDLVDENTTLDEMREAFQILGSIDSKYGIFYVYGNHDKSFYRPDPNYTTSQLREAIEAGGIQILADEVYPIGTDLLLVGRDDVSRPLSGESRSSAWELMQGLDTERFILLVDHQPLELEQNAALGYDLLLSGHTHGGQIWPLGLINEFLGINEINAGQRKIGDFQAIVSTGIAGWGFPMKTEGAAEYVMIDIRQVDK
ncbi:metallophosphoesterase [Hominifimenecus sp. rT4P-3]|uniref:metallophosphoesterase n=1 Tax=Hominifimenecus sp. rT4P-3 TaxID=3242979 RepID=UPI003DA44341